MKAVSRALLASLAALLATACTPGPPSPAAGATLASFEAASLADGRPLRFEASDGAVVLNVWATWCEPCRREMASLERAHRALAAQGIRVVGVNVDRDVLLAREQARRMGLTFPNLSDPSQALARDRLGVTRLPTTVAVGTDGRLRWREESARDWAQGERLAWIARSVGPGAR